MLTQLVYWSLVGWCGTVPKRFPFPKPDPWPWWKNALFGIVGGIAGGFLANQGLGFDELVAISFGAFSGGRIISEVAGSFMNLKNG